MVWIPKEPKYKPKPPNPNNTPTNTPTNTPMNRGEAIKVLRLMEYKYLIRTGSIFDTALNMAIEALKADMVEVVRCKDCRHHDDFFVGAEGSLLCWKGGTDRVVSAMGYCECGERREE